MMNFRELFKCISCTRAKRLEQSSQEHFGSVYQYWIKIGNVVQEKDDVLQRMNKFTRNPWQNQLKIISIYYQGDQEIEINCPICSISTVNK